MDLQKEYTELMETLGNQNILISPPLKVRLTPHSPDILIEFLRVGDDVESFGVAKHSVLQKLRHLVAKQKENYAATFEASIKRFDVNKVYESGNEVDLSKVYKLPENTDNLTKLRHRIFEQTKIEIYILDKDIPILGTKMDISGGKPALFGLYRDRFPDRDWPELRWKNLEMDTHRITKITSMSDYSAFLINNQKFPETLLEDLAYTYGNDTKKFTEKIQEFKLIWRA